MRPMFRTMFLALLAVLASSAVGSASASAAECKHTAKSTTFCTEAVEHEISCAGGEGTKGSSHLALGAEPLEMKTTETIALAGANKGKKWSLWEQ